MLGLRKPNFVTKIIPFENLTMPKTVKGVGQLRFFNIDSVAKSQKLKGRFGNFEKFSKEQKLRIFNSLIVPKK